MDKQKLIEILVEVFKAEYQNGERHPTLDLGEDSINKACDAIEAEMPHWISVKERLPEDGDAVLVYPQRRSEVLGYSKFPTKELPRPCFFDSEHIPNYGDSLYEVEGITHWQPLPAQPKEVESE